MEYIPLSFLAGVLTVLSPCVLPVLPIIIGGSLADGHDRMKPFIITFSLAASIVIFTLLLKVSTTFIGVDEMVLKTFSGGIVITLGLIYIFPTLWEKLSIKLNLQGRSSKLLQSSKEKKGITGSILTGIALGPVFASCSPTYFFILGTVLPQSFTIGLINLIVYAAGLSILMLIIALLGQRAVSKLAKLQWFNTVIGILFIVVGLGILSGVDKKIEAYLIKNGLFNATVLEEQFLPEQ